MNLAANTLTFDLHTVYKQINDLKKYYSIMYFQIIYII